MSWYRGQLEELVGEQLNIVAFVMDYVEFHFNGPVLRALTHPLLNTGREQFAFPLPGSRDALCTLIGTGVASVDVQEDRWIRLEMADGKSLTIPLDQEARVGPEAAHYVPANERGDPQVEQMLIW